MEFFLEAIEFCTGVALCIIIAFCAVRLYWWSAKTPADYFLRSIRRSIGSQPPFKEFTLLYIPVATISKRLKMFRWLVLIAPVYVGVFYGLRQDGLIYIMILSVYLFMVMTFTPLRLQSMRSFNQNAS